MQSSAPIYRLGIQVLALVLVLSAGWSIKHAGFSSENDATSMHPSHTSTSLMDAIDRIVIDPNEILAYEELSLSNMYATLADYELQEVEHQTGPPLSNEDGLLSTEDNSVALSDSAEDNDPGIISETLNFGTTVLCIPVVKTFQLLSHQPDGSPIEVISARATTSHFYVDITEGDGAISLRIIFLPITIGYLTDQVILESSIGVFTFLLRGSATVNEFGLLPVIHHGLSLGETLTTSMSLHNPLKEPLSVLDVSSTDPRLTLSFPTPSEGNAPGPSLWMAQPGESLQMFNLTFTATELGPYSAYINVRTETMGFVVPVILHVAARGISAPRQVIDVGTVGTNEGEDGRDFAVEVYSSHTQPLRLERVELLHRLENATASVLYNKSQIIEPSKTSKLHMKIYFDPLISPQPFNASLTIRGVDSEGETMEVKVELRAHIVLRAVSPSSDVVVDISALLEQPGQWVVLSNISFVNEFLEPIELVNASSDLDWLRVGSWREIEGERPVAAPNEPMPKLKLEGRMPEDEVIPKSGTITLTTNVSSHSFSLHIISQYLSLSSAFPYHVQKQRAASECKFHCNSLLARSSNSSSPTSDFSQQQCEECQVFRKYTMEYGPVVPESQPVLFFNLTNEYPDSLLVNGLLLSKVLSVSLLGISRGEQSTFRQYPIPQNLSHIINAFAASLDHWSRQIRESTEEDYLLFDTSESPLVIPPGFVLMLSAELGKDCLDPMGAGCKDTPSFSFFTSTKEVLQVEATFSLLDGSLALSSEALEFEPTFPGKIQLRKVFAHNCLNVTVRILAASSDDSRVQIVVKNPLISPGQTLEIGFAVLSPAYLSLCHDVSAFADCWAPEVELKGLPYLSSMEENLTAEDIEAYRVRSRRFREMVETGSDALSASILLETSVYTSLQVVVSSRIILPELTSPSVISFPVTGTQSLSKRFIEVTNPSDVPIAVSLDPFLDAADIASFSSLGGISPCSETIGNNGYPVFYFSGDAVLEARLEPEQTVALGPLIFRPEAEGNFTATLWLRNELTHLTPIRLEGLAKDPKLSIYISEESSRLANQDSQRSLYGMPALPQMQGVSQEAEIRKGKQWKEVKNGEDLRFEASMDQRRHQDNPKLSATMPRDIELRNEGLVPVSLLSVEIVALSFGDTSFSISPALSPVSRPLKPNESLSLRILYSPDCSSRVTHRTLVVKTPSVAWTIQLEGFLPSELAADCLAVHEGDIVYLKMAAIGAAALLLLTQFLSLMKHYILQRSQPLRTWRLPMPSNSSGSPWELPYSSSSRYPVTVSSRNQFQVAVPNLADKEEGHKSIKAPVSCGREDKGLTTGNPMHSDIGGPEKEEILYTERQTEDGGRHDRGGPRPERPDQELKKGDDVHEDMPSNRALDIPDNQPRRRKKRGKTGENRQERMAGRFLVDEGSEANLSNKEVSERHFLVDDKLEEEGFVLNRPSSPPIAVTAQAQSRPGENREPELMQVLTASEVMTMGSPDVPTTKLFSSIKKEENEDPAGRRAAKRREFVSAVLDSLAQPASPRSPAQRSSPRSSDHERKGTSLHGSLPLAKEFEDTNRKDSPKEATSSTSTYSSSPRASWNCPLEALKSRVAGPDLPAGKDKKKDSEEKVTERLPERDVPSTPLALYPIPLRLPDESSTTRESDSRIRLPEQQPTSYGREHEAPSQRRRKGDRPRSDKKPPETKAQASLPVQPAPNERELKEREQERKIKDMEQDDKLGGTNVRNSNPATQSRVPATSASPLVHDRTVDKEDANHGPDTPRVGLEHKSEEREERGLINILGCPQPETALTESSSRRRAPELIFTGRSGNSYFSTPASPRTSPSVVPLAGSIIEQMTEQRAKRGREEKLEGSSAQASLSFPISRPTGRVPAPPGFEELDGSDVAPTLPPCPSKTAEVGRGSGVGSGWPSARQGSWLNGGQREAELGGVFGPSFFYGPSLFPPLPPLIDQEFAPRSNASPAFPPPLFPPEPDLNPNPSNRTETVGGVGGSAGEDEFYPLTDIPVHLRFALEQSEERKIDQEDLPTALCLSALAPSK